MNGINEPSVRYDTWVTEDGRRLKIVDMEDSHLRNTIRFLIAKRAAMALADTPKHEWQRELWRKKDRVRASQIAALEAEVARRLRAMSTSTEVPV